MGVYILLGALGVVLLCVLAVVLTSNQINSKTEDLAKVKVEEQGVKQVADALRPYGQFAQIQQARRLQIRQLASGRFDWERSLRQFSLAIPSNVWILGISASVSPGVTIDDSGGGGDAASLREKADSPAFTLTGCTYSQHAVARMMTRMRNLDEVTDVQLAKSVRKDDTSAAAGATAAPAQNGQAASELDSQDCVGSNRIVKFDMLVVFGSGNDAATGAGGTATGTGTAAASSTQQSLDKANAAAAQGQAASAAATSATPAGGTK